MATSHFYHGSYFCRFCSIFKLTLLLLTFDLWFVTSKLQWLQQYTHKNGDSKIAYKGNICCGQQNSYFHKIKLPFAMVPVSSKQ